MTGRLTITSQSLMAYFLSRLVVAAVERLASVSSRLAEARRQKGKQFVAGLEVELTTRIDLFDPAGESMLQGIGVRTEAEHERVSHTETSVRHAPRTMRETRVLFLSNSSGRCLDQN